MANCPKCGRRKVPLKDMGGGLWLRYCKSCGVTNALFNWSGNQRIPLLKIAIKRANFAMLRDDNPSWSTQAYPYR